MNSKSKVFDYGCGLGYFLLAAKERFQCTIVGYDKFMDSEEEFIYKDFSLVEQKGPFSHITCFETLEHCHPPEQLRILKIVDEQLENNGQFIVSVPIEIGPISIFKNFFRRNTKDATFPDFTFWNILKTGLYRPTTWHRDTLEYPGHFGFDHRKLEALIESQSSLHIKKKTYSPFSQIKSLWFNSQVFYVLEKG